jgi:dihydrofolate synthase / folylpolyglutamate synthase
VSELFARVGSPQLRYPVFHVAGTNGKGSTVATLNALLRGAGLRVGRYTSPHLVDFRERIVVDDVAISRQAVGEWLLRHEEEAVRLGATFFETTTVLALDHFAASDVDVAVVEVGLGGRLDATNVVHPVATCVTQIGFDHTEFLGTTLREIAAEKAGIFKAGVPAVIGELDPVIRSELRSHAEAAGSAGIIAAGIDWHVSQITVDASGTTFDLADERGRRRLHTPLIGEFQAHNTAAALATLRSAGGQWAEVEANAPRHLPAVRLPGRFHRSGAYLFDVAHNTDGIRSLAENIRRLRLPGPVSALVTVLKDKDWRGILRGLHGVVDTIVISTAPTAPAARMWHLDDVATWAREEEIALSVEPDFDAALRKATDSGSTVVITGSFHTVGDAMERLQVDPLAR